MTATATSIPQRLPAWRLSLAILILGAMAAVLLSLGPVYLKDYKLKRYFREVAAASDSATRPDEALQAAIAGRARELGLPLQPAEVKISHNGGHLQMEMRYAVHFQVYQVDLHFHASASH